MKKEEIISAIKDVGIVAVIRAESAEEAFKLISAVKDGGINNIEVTMTVPGAIDVIKDVSEKYGDEIVLGAGSVLDPETARSCLLAGVEYIVSPIFNSETVKLCNSYQKPCMPGAMSVTEVYRAMEAGADIVKIFPASLFGPKIIKSIKGPLPQAELMPTGGVSLDNVDEWIKAGSVAVGVGGGLLKPAKDGDYNVVTERAEKFISKIAETRREINN